MAPSTTIHDLKVLVSSYHPVLVIETVEEERVRTLLGQVAAQLNIGFFEWSVTRGLTKVGDPGISTSRLTAEPQSLLQHLESLRVDAIFWLKDFSEHLKTPELNRRFRELMQLLSKRKVSLVLTAGDVKLAEEIEAGVVRVDLKLPDQAELSQVLDALIYSSSTMGRFPIQLGPSDKDLLVRTLYGMTLNQARQALAQVLLEDGQFSTEDLPKLMQRKAQAIREGGLLEFYPAEDNRYEIGGFANLKAWLSRAAVGFTEEAKALNLKAPKGVLLVGVQGCGKSLAAKFIAREWKMPLLKLDAGRLFDKYIGESEKNFRKAISLAESISPCVLWIDEIEKGLAPTGTSESDGGLSRRLFGSFLTWLQEKKQEVFVVATANDLFVLPPELLRKGRFDEIFFVDLPNQSERETILKIHLGLRKQDPARFDLAKIVAATDGFSGAEIEQAVIASLYRVLAQKKPLDTASILEEVKQTIPLSVTRSEDIQRLRETAKSRFVSVR